ncbi:MAG: hypothetical protein IJ597_00260 [Synergistaceae bacterium]|nr:hypothetical protein [Synergistaceae bacterium]
MSANIITFEGQYMADQMRKIDRARTHIDEAVQKIKGASQHRNWKCPETHEIDNGIEIISNRLYRLNNGVTRTGIALGNGLVSFHELEQRSQTQANELSNELKNNYGFEATYRTLGANAFVVTTIIPPIQGGKITVSSLQTWFKELQKRIHEFWTNFFNNRANNGNNDNGNGHQAPTSSNNSTSTAQNSERQSENQTSQTTVNEPQYNGTPKENIWNFLQEKIGNNYGVAALMGNLQAEGSFSSNNLQNSYEKSIGMNDDEYTAAVDNGNYDNFVHDSAGYGIAQWTYYSRKQGLLDFAREKGTSIGDLQTQLEYLWKELSEGYQSVINALKNATSIREASDVVLKQFERPYDQSESACAYRASLGENIYSELYAG